MIKLTATRRVSPESLELAQKALDSGLTTVNGISKASGISRDTVRRMLARVGRKTPAPYKPAPIYYTHKPHPLEAKLREVAGQIVRGEI